MITNVSNLLTYPHQTPVNFPVSICNWPSEKIRDLRVCYYPIPSLSYSWRESEVLSPKGRPDKANALAGRYFNSWIQAALRRLLSSWALAQRSTVGRMNNMKMMSKNIGNKAKGRISKRVFPENKARQIFRKTENFLPHNTHTYVSVGIISPLSLLLSLLLLRLLI